MAGGASVGVGEGTGVGVGMVVGVFVGDGTAISILVVGGGVLANEGVQANKLNRQTVFRKSSLINGIILNSVGGMMLL
jgi:hypothetical protein